MRLRTSFPAVLLAAVLVVLPASDLRAQTLEAAAGGAGGFLAGTTVTLGLIVLDAQLERDFLESPLDLLGPRGAPAVAGAALGIGTGLGDPELLEDLGVGAGLGLLVGGTLGAGVGWLWTDRAEGPWIGGTIGAAVGVLVGTVVGAFFLDESDAPRDGLVILQVPVPVGW